MKKVNPYAIDGDITLTRHYNIECVTIGHGCTKSLAKLEGARIALIIDEYLQKSDFFVQFEKNVLSKVEYSLICTIKDEPSYEAIDLHIPTIKDYSPTHIVALGGGSTIDTAKALWAFYEHLDLTWETYTSFEPIPQFPGKAKLIAIPSTSGTGAEATWAAVYKKYDGTKALVIDRQIHPSEVYLEFDLLETLPPEIIAISGLDALTHVVGGLSVESINLLDQMLCTTIAAKIINTLPQSFRGEGEMCRDMMHICSYMAGVEINNAGGGLEHKLDMFAKAYHIPHGKVVGIFLPYTMLYLMEENHYVDLAVSLGMQGDTLQQKQRNLVEHIWNMYDILGMPKTIKEVGVPEEEFIAQIPKFIDMVVEIGHVDWIKGYKGADSLKQLYLDAYYGIK